MNRLNQLQGTELVWKQPKFGVDHYELFAGENLYAELYWTKWFSDRATAICSGKQWMFDRVGFFRSKVIAVNRDGETTAAQFEFDWTKGGVIRLAKGLPFRWHRTKALRNTWALEDMNEQVLFEMELGMRWFKYQAWVDLHTLPRDMVDLDLLLPLCLYLAICAMQDTAAVTAATTAAISS